MRSASIRSLPAASALAVLLACGGGKDPGHPVPSAVDAESVLRLIRQSKDLIADARQNSALFRHPEGKPLSPDEKEELMRLWATFIDHDLAFSSLKARFLERWDRVPDPKSRDRTLVVGYAAHAAQLRAGMFMLSAVSGKDVFEAALNEASPELGVTAGNLDAVSRRVVSPNAILILRNGSDSVRRAFKRLETGLSPQQQSQVQKFGKVTRDAALEAEKLYEARGVKLMNDTARGIAAAEVQKVVAPVQKDIALWLGDTRVRAEGESLITKAQLDALVSKMEPGDIVVERRNWFLSNIGLPGFWPHAELFVGTAAEMAAYFDKDPEVVKAFPGGFTATLSSRHPESWTTFNAVAHDGAPHRIVEAISEGVVFSSFYEAALADYIGAIRPRLTKVEKARAIARAFTHVKKPYDFDFDFLTDAELVCSELVYKVFQSPAAEGRSIAFKLTKIMGRTTLPPTDMVKQFDVEYGTSSQQLDFVGFLDGREGEGRAVEATLDDFRKSHRRPKWDISQQ